jgi:hypothetical protein
MRSSIQRLSKETLLCKPFSLQHIAHVEPQTQERQFLIEGLWLSSGVGILGGAPKSYKTFFAVDIALSVASGTPALGHFLVHQKGPVLFYGAEDHLSALRVRFDYLAAARGLSLEHLPLYLLDEPVLRLDRATDVKRLRSSIESIKPRLLVLDPFVRIAKIDENSASDVSSVLGSLREINRDYDVALTIVHHTRKSPSAQMGYALRGSGDFAAWSDTNLFLFGRHPRLTLSLEHRSAPAPAPFHLTLKTSPAPHLVVDEHDSGQPPQKMTTTLEQAPQNELTQEVLKHLAASPTGLSTVKLRKLLCKRKQDVVEVLKTLSSLGMIERGTNGWTLSSLDGDAARAVPCSQPQGFALEQGFGNTTPFD